MKVKIEITDSFERNFKRLFKRYKSLPSDLSKLKSDLLKNPRIGEHLGKGIYKIRLAVKSKGKGKGGGARIITHQVIYTEVSKHLITLLTIYDKSETENITENEIVRLLKKNNII